MRRGFSPASLDLRAYDSSTANGRGAMSVSQVQEPTGTPMVRPNSVSFRLSIAAVVFGLYALCMMGGPRAHEVERDVVVRHADRVISGTSPLEYGHLRHVAHHPAVRALSRASSPTSLFKAACIVTPDFAGALLARENVLALGGAPRASGPTRAPPAA